MTSSPHLKEKEYREDKQKNLQNILGEFCNNISWIWIDGASRRKATFQIDGKNRLGFFAQKSHNLIEIDSDPLAEEKISALIPDLKKLLSNQEQNFYTQITVTLFDSGLDVVMHGKKALDFSQTQKLMNFAKEHDFNISYQYSKSTTPIFLIRKNQIFYPDFKINLTSDIFIQATKSGLENIIKIIRSQTSFEKGLRVADIYAGFGAYSFAIQDLVKSITAFEGDEEMVDLISKNAAANNLGNKIKAHLRDLFLDPLGKKELKDFDLAILNPPRNGATPQVLEIAKSPLKKVIYVSCNPVSFKQDAKILIDSGFTITSLNAIDQFYSTQHLELVSIFTR